MKWGLQVPVEYRHSVVPIPELPIGQAGQVWGRGHSPSVQVLYLPSMAVADSTLERWRVEVGPRYRRRGLERYNWAVEVCSPG
jgi:hypothetical protein